MATELLNVCQRSNNKLDGAVQTSYLCSNRKRVRVCAVFSKSLGGRRFLYAQTNMFSFFVL